MAVGIRQRRVPGELAFRGELLELLVVAQRSRLRALRLDGLPLGLELLRCISR